MRNDFNRVRQIRCRLNARAQALLQMALAVALRLADACPPPSDADVYKDGRVRHCSPAALTFLSPHLLFSSFLSPSFCLAQAVMLSFAHFTTFFLSLLVCVCHVSAAPIGRPSQSLAARCNVAARDNSTTTVDITASNGTSTSGNGTDITSTGNSTTSTEPRWVVYGDQWVSGITGPPPAADLAVSTAAHLSI